MNGAGTFYQDLLNNVTTFTDSINISGLDPSSVPYVDASQNLTDYVLTNGQFLIGSSGDDPQASTLTGTDHQINVTNGPGSITLSTPQPIDTTSDVTFAGITDTGLTSALVSSNNGLLQDTAITNDNSNGTNTFITLSGSTLTLNSSMVQDLGLTATPVFNSLLLITSDTNNFLQFQTQRGQGNVTYEDGVGTIVNDAVGGNKVQINSSVATNNNILDDGSGNTTISGNLTVNGLSASELIATNSSKQFDNVTISNTNANGTNNNLSFSGTTLTLASNLNQNLDTNGSPSFSGLTVDSGTTMTSIHVKTTGGGSSWTHQDGVGCTIQDDIGFGFIQISSDVTTKWNTLDDGSGNLTAVTITDTSLTGSALIATDGDSELQSVTISNSNGSNGSFSGSTLNLSNTQDLSISGSPTFSNITDSGLTASKLIAT
ncbi:MAG TPA: hypothetical protein VHD33_01020, partial [Legionellaceae bacterium]|nr:hypothetical protein [Legionellaceae bacterium]